MELNTEFTYINQKSTDDLMHNDDNGSHKFNAATIKGIAKCNGCGPHASVNFDVVTAYYICGTCSVELEKHYDTGPERRFVWSPDKKDIRRSETVSYNRLSLETNVGNSIRPSKARINRLNRAQNIYSVSKSDEYKYKNIMSEIKKLVFGLQMPQDTLIQSGYILSKIFRYKKDGKDIINGRKYSKVASGILYSVTRMSKNPRLVNDIVAASGLSKKEIFSMYNIIRKNLDLKIQAVDPLLYVENFSSKLGIRKDYEYGDEIIRDTYELILNIKKHANFYQGKDPKNIVIVSLDIVAKRYDQTIKVDDLVSVGHLSNVCITNLRKKIYALVENH